MTTQPTYAERVAVWRQGNPDKQLTFDLLLEICDATNLRGVNLADADLWGANLSGANLSDADLADANLRGANLSGVNLTDADLSGANLTDAPLRYADLRGANLSGADLWDADLSGANLGGADLRGGYLWGADLSGADLSGANLTDADLSRANLGGADLRGVYWSGLQITGLPSGQIVLTPTPVGWELRVGCWTGTIDGLRTLIAQDEGWPAAEGDEITRRRPGLQAASAFIEAHIAMHPNVINQLEAKWGTK